MTVRKDVPGIKSIRDLSGKLESDWRRWIYWTTFPDRKSAPKQT